MQRAKKHAWSLTRLRNAAVRLVLLALLIVWPSAVAVAVSDSPLGNRAFRAERLASAEEIPAAFLQFCPLEERLFEDAGDGRLDEFSLFEAALVAGGVQRIEVLRQYAKQGATLTEELRQSDKLTGSPRRRAEAVFQFLHGRVLYGGYSIESTNLRTVLDEGRFNCVSASVLFNYLAGEVGLVVCGLEMPSHAMSRVFLPDGPLDVETTCPNWFSLVGDPKRQAKVVEKMIDRHLAKDQSTAREISPVQMIAMIYYNRGVDLLSKKRFDRAAVANAKAYRLDPHSTTARGNLLATINNWSIALGSAGRYAEAAALLRQGFSINADYGPFAVNYVHVHHQWVEDLCGAGRFEEALDVLARGAVAQPSRPYFRKAPSEVHRRWSRTLGTLERR